MKNLVNPALIGGFLLGAVALVIGALVIFGSGRLFKEWQTNVVYFRGSVNGLNVGSPVMFRGVAIGRVKEIRVICDMRDLSFRIPVVIQTDPDLIRTTDSSVGGPSASSQNLKEDFIGKLIERGLRAQLQIQSLVTGQLFVQLDFFPDSPLLLAGSGDGYQEIPTVPSSFEEVSRTLEKIPLDQLVQKVVDTLNGIERMVNSKELTASLGSLAKTLAAVETLATRTDAHLGKLVTGVDGTLVEIRHLSRNLDAQVGPVGGSLREAAQAARDAFNRSETSLARLEGTLAEGSAERRELRQALQEVAGAARAVRVLAEALEQRPEMLLRGRTGGTP